jgi:hypothetical protein
MYSSAVLVFFALIMLLAILYTTATNTAFIPWQNNITGGRLLPAMVDVALRQTRAG